MGQKIPVFYSKKQNLEGNLERFLIYVEDSAFLDETEDQKIGWQYIENAKNGLKLNDVLKNIDEYGTDKLIALVAIAKEEGISDADLKDLILGAINIEPTSGFGGENYAFNVPVKTEIEIDLHKIPGKLDTVKYDDIYQKLKDLLDEETVTNILENSSNLIENDVMTVDIPQYYWGAYIDEEKFKDKLVSKIDMTEEEVEQLAKIG
jgi:hypothetical protein